MHVKFSICACFFCFVNFGLVCAQDTFMGIPQYGNGPYRFVLCNPSQGAALINLFQTTGRALEQQIYPEALKGPKSLAFKTFFSTNSATTIANVFSDINLGATTKSVDKKSTKPPVFACVNPETDIGMVHWAQWTCQKFGYTAFMETSGLFVFFCPSFWNNNMNLDGPHSVYCPKLNRDGTAYATDGIGVGTGKYLNKNRVATIIHELAHTYSTNVGSDEVYALNEIIKREPAFQLGNPSNYMYFSSCIIAGCTEYLGSFDDGELRRKLGEGNNTSTAGVLEGSESTFGIATIPAEYLNSQSDGT